MYVVNLCIIEFILSRPANYLHIKKIDKQETEQGYLLCHKLY